MRPIVIHNLIAGLLYGGTLVMSTTGEWLIRARGASRGRSATEWSFFVGLFVTIACLTGATVAALAGPAPLPGGVWWPAIVGMATLWVGIALRLWSVATLGRFFKLTVVIQQGHRVVDRGPYRRLRHPAYLGLILCFTGLGLVGSDWISLILMLGGSTAVCILRIHFEERVLVQALGNEYVRYMQRTARLVPGIY